MFLTLLFSLRRRPGVPPDVFYDYWVNAHAAQIAARLPGIDHLWLHEIDYEAGQIWPRTPDVSSELAVEDRFDGVPEPCFETEDHLNAFLAGMEPLMSDEANIFEETVAYASAGPSSRTFTDDTPSCFEAPGLLKFLLFIRKAPAVDLDEFRSYMVECFATPLAAVDEVRKLRMHLFEPFSEDSEMANASAVSALAPPPRRFDAAVEIAFADGLALGRFAQSPAWLRGAEHRARHLAACHAFKVNRTHHLKSDGLLTFHGLRTPIVARAIERVTAVSQLSPSVLALQTTGVQG